MNRHPIAGATCAPSGISMASIAVCVALALGGCGGGGGGESVPGAGPGAGAGAGPGAGAGAGPGAGVGAGVGAGAGNPAQAAAITSLAPTHGQAGIVVTLTGTGFSPVAAENDVFLNNKRCTVDSATPTQLQVEVPAQAGSGPFEVTVRAQAPTVQSPAFTYDLTGVSVSTLAGQDLGFQDGIGAEAQFHSPAGLLLDPNGLLYVGDTGNHRIRTVTVAGATGAFVGSSTEGDVNGAGAQAEFSFPGSMVFDAASNLVVADPGNNDIRRVSPTGLVTTLLPATAGLDGPAGVAFDDDGNLYVTDQGHHRIVKIDSSGALTTLAGGTPGAADGTGAAAQFQFPAGLAFCGNALFVADKDNNEIRKVALDGVVTTYAGGIGGLGFADGSLTEARFLQPRHVACDREGKLFVVDTGNERIRMITPAGVVTTLAGNVVPGFADGDGAIARFSSPNQVAVRPDGTLLISDAANNRIRQIDWR